MLLDGVIDGAGLDPLRLVFVVMVSTFAVSGYDVDLSGRTYGWKEILLLDLGSL